MIKAIVFDIGQTLVNYSKPLNWSKLYRPVFESIADNCGYIFSERHYQHAATILTKYNTRINPREHEVSSTQIFTEILSGMDIPIEELEQVKYHFYTYFRQDASLFPEVEGTLKALSDKGIILGTLSDVAYGMDNGYALEDIASIAQYIDYPFTSNDTGFRKPSAKGLELLAEKMKVDIRQIAFVGDEEKDMACARNASAYPILINRSGEKKDYGQGVDIFSLKGLLNILLP